MKNPLYYLKLPLLLLLSGYLARTTGALMKILHWRGADNTIIAATIMMTIAILWLMTKIFFVRKPNPDHQDK
jgi:ABC-type uncharacterized transport system permease subunit